MLWRSRVVAAAGLIILAACAREPARPVENLSSGHDVSRFRLASLKGTRNGDRLDVWAVYSDGADRITVALRFRVTPPTHLDSGTWSGFGKGTVRERSSTFLGGQSGPPSIGGRFDLIAPDGTPLYRVTIPLQPLKDRL